jgi:glycosyltransferase involved in cell wall biosynthesis
MTLGTAGIPAIPSDGRRLVSIIIRNHNYARYLCDAIDSAIAQDYPAVQIIIVDDGSTDRSRDIIRNYAPRCDVVLREHGGEGAGVNDGFAASHGQIVIFLDADDVLAPDAVAEIAKFWLPGVSRIHFPLRIMNEQGLLSSAVTPRFRVPAMDLAAYLELYGYIPSGAQSCNAYADWALRKVLPLDAECWWRAPDAYLNALTTAQGRVGVIERPLGGYRIHPSNLSLQNSALVGTETAATLVHTKMHAAILGFVGSERWASMRPRLPTYHWMHRLLSLRLNPNHPFTGDRLMSIAARCLVSIAERPHTSLRRRLLLVTALFGSVLLPHAVLDRLLEPAMRFVRRCQYPSSFRPDQHWRRAVVGSTAAPAEPSSSVGSAYGPDGR